jgi:hypothetical protein
LEINLRWAVKRIKKEGRIFYYIQKLATYVGYFNIITLGIEALVLV